MFGLGLAFLPAAWADPASDACAALVDARSALYSMMNAKDKSAQDALNAKVQAASTKLDSVLAGMTGAHAKVAADFKAVGDQFKATRSAGSGNKPDLAAISPMQSQNITRAICSSMTIVSKRSCKKSAESSPDGPYIRTPSGALARRHLFIGEPPIRAPKNATRP
jgi:hypothetical protein